MRMYSLDYFARGPYKGAKISGIAKYFGKYFWARRFYAKLVDRITPKKGAILEMGCGFGDLLKFLEEDYQTVGIDISRDAIKEARKRLKKTKLLIMTAKQIDRLENNSFDTVIASHILEHLKNPKAAIKKVFKLLKPKGIFFIVVPNTLSLGRKIKRRDWVGYRDKTHISLYDPERWFKLLQEAGFSIEKTFGDGLWDSPYLPIIPQKIQQLFFGFPAVVQTISTIPFIPVNLGESLVVVAKRNG